MSQVKLHLGCYDRKIHGFVNIDIREDVNPDVVDDVFKLKKFEKNSVDLIYACHVLEHADYVDSELAMIMRYNWRETEHFHIDDYSQTYFPHMDKESGKLMSLNVEAIK